eukprot:700304-Hanusia_phi.AAC.1
MGRMDVIRRLSEVPSHCAGSEAAHGNLPCENGFQVCQIGCQCPARFNGLISNGAAGDQCPGVMRPIPAPPDAHAAASLGAPRSSAGRQDGSGRVGMVEQHAALAQVQVLTVSLVGS